MKIGICNDHRGVNKKNRIIELLNNYEIINFGTDSEERCDYPEFAEKVAKAVQTKECEKGILVCGTGFGVTIVANKFKGIRCASCWNEDVAKLLKGHNHANIIALPGRFINTSQAIVILRAWIATEFMGGRHQERLQMIENTEKENMK